MIYWNAQPEAAHLGPIVIRWYGLLFASAFMGGYQVTGKLFDVDGVSHEYLDPLIVTTAIGTVVGARLGHTLFYEPNIYLADPIRILKIWEGGLASHGAAIGIILALWIYCRRHPEFRLVWLMDRLCIGVILGGGLIRLGNFFNSEILGKATDLPWAVVFARVDSVPRHPAQLYESIAYFGIFTLLFTLFFRKPTLRKRTGFLFGLFLALVFGFRILIELCKENQVAFESSLPLDMGQLLSIPLVLIGIIMMVWAWKKGEQPGPAVVGRASPAPAASKNKKKR